MSFVDSALTAADALIGDILTPYALIASPSRYIGTIFPDVTVREVHSDTNVITAHPVETGTPVSDHVFANPQVIEIACGFSDSTGGYVGYSQDVYQEFLALRDTRQPFDVSTGKRLYQNMLFGEIAVVTDPSSEYALMVTARLQQVIISSTSGGDGGSGLDPNAQSLPAETTPTTNVGSQSLGPAASPGLTPAGFVAGPN